MAARSPGGPAGNRGDPPGAAPPRDCGRGAGRRPGVAARYFASLAIPAYRRFFVGDLASMLGFWMRVVVQGWLVYEITLSKAALGTVSAVGLFPFVVLSPVGGLLADRVDRRRMLTLLPLVAVAANLVLAALVWTGSVTVVHVMVTALFIGSARAVEIPMRNAFVRDLVELDTLTNAVALNAASFNSARLLGPALGAGVLALFGMEACFVVAGALNLTMTLVLLGHPARGRKASRPAGGVWAQLGEGFSYVRGHRRTRLLLLLLLLSILFAWNYQTLMPAYARDALGLAEEGYMGLMAASGAGALLGALFVAGRRGGGSRRNTLFGLMWGGAAAILLLGLVHETWLAVPLLVGVGFCQVGFAASANGMIQESVPDALRGRVMGIWSFTFGTTYPLGSLLMGGVAEAWGIPVAWAGGSALLVLLSGIVRLRLPPRHLADAEADAERAARREEGVREAEGAPVA